MNSEGMEEGLTHKQLVLRLSKWLKFTKRYKIVISELSTINSETPDIIAWQGHASSILIECKTSRADFMADKKKHFRKSPTRGMGDIRYFAAPKGMLSIEEIPDGWGLLEVDDEKYIKEKKKPEFIQANKKNECVMLMSALRRLEISTAVYVVHEQE
jgi:hypothetical protein